MYTASNDTTTADVTATTTSTAAVAGAAAGEVLRCGRRLAADGVTRVPLRF